MNVLVVDDQYDVVQGVVSGVNWSSLGVSWVFSAHSVEQACAILQEQPVHVLLCDIELPPRNGFEVLDYIHEHDLPTQSIFLTAHASFEYARTAVKKGGFDYLLQPAPYEEIEQAVSKALLRFRETQSMEQERAYGRYWRDKEELLLDGCLGKFLHSGNPQALDTLIENLKKLRIWVGPDTVVLPVLLYSRIQSNWKKALRMRSSEVLNRFSSEQRQTYCIADMQEDGLLILVINEFAKLEDIVSIFDDLFRKKEFSAACYIGQKVSFRGLLQEYGDLCRRRHDNVAGYTGVFKSSRKPATNQ